MRRDEFSAWVTYHRARFPYWGAWLDGMTGLSRTETLDAMYGDCLSFLRLHECEEASRAMGGDERLVPRDYDNHARRIKKLVWKDRDARGWKPARGDVEDCALCARGWVHVYAAETALGVRFKDRVSESATCVVLCNCTAGDQAKEALPRPVERYSTEFHVPVAAKPWRRRGLTEAEWEARIEGPVRMPTNRELLAAVGAEPLLEADGGGAPF